MAVSPIWGGELPPSPALKARATNLARRGWSLPCLLARGFFGLDLILGDDPAGSGDVVIEVNPRLTTSYVGLLAQGNLAAALLAVVAGECIRKWSFARPDTIHPMAVCNHNRNLRLVFRIDRSYFFQFPMNWLALDIGGANLKVS